MYSKCHQLQFCESDIMILPKVEKSKILHSDLVLTSQNVFISCNAFTHFKGYFCVSGSTFPQPCPAGTYGNSTGLRRSEDCSPCPGGKYCEGFANTEYTDLCDPGFYCIEKAYTSVSISFALKCSLHLGLLWL